MGRLTPSDSQSLALIRSGPGKPHRKISGLKSLGLCFFFLGLKIWLEIITSRDLGTSLPLTRVSQALRARNPEKVSKMSPGASGPEPEKVPKKSTKSPESLQKVLGECFRTFPRLLGDN